ncbi:MAG: hypothetical protein KDA80_00590, partial [Planctomycetaceae bacterium]|nr:hypothetical protein [Planctomycetaceae bacterium]
GFEFFRFLQANSTHGAIFLRATVVTNRIAVDPAKKESPNLREWRWTQVEREWDADDADSFQ